MPHEMHSWSFFTVLHSLPVLSRKRDSGLWYHLIQEEQYIVEAYDGGRLDRELQNLLSQKIPMYRGAAASVANLQRGQRWRQRQC